MAKVLQQLVQSGVAVSQFREMASDLEDAFLTVASANDSSSPNDSM
ncbi:MAG: hypothetical protein ACK494_02010 [Planctomycetota bacterium]|jgi:hypothetical protein